MRGIDNCINNKKSLHLFNHAESRHPQSTIDMVGNTVPGETLYEKSKEKIRLRNARPSPTQLAGGISLSFQL
jgi:hypothetical protein